MTFPQTNLIKHSLFGLQVLCWSNIGIAHHHLLFCSDVQVFFVRALFKFFFFFCTIFYLPRFYQIKFNFIISFHSDITGMASSSVSQEDFDNDFELTSRRSRIRTARARVVPPRTGDSSSINFQSNNMFLLFFFFFIIHDIL